MKLHFHDIFSVISLTILSKIDEFTLILQIIF